VRFPKSARLIRRGEFVAVQERGKRVHGGGYVVFALENDRGCARLGVSVSKRIGSAVTRNRVKRWVREAFRAAAPALPAIDVLVIARPGAPEGGLGCARRAIAAAERVARP
jgi:ribonuclease P protein component